MIHNACKCFQCFAKAHSTLYTPQDYFASIIFPLFKEHFDKLKKWARPLGASDLFSFSLFFTHTSFIFSLILHPPFFISFSFVFLLLSLCFIFFLLFCQPPLSSVFIPFFFNIYIYIYNVFFLILFFSFSLSTSLFSFYLFSPFMILFYNFTAASLLSPSLFYFFIFIFILFLFLLFLIIITNQSSFLFFKWFSFFLLFSLSPPLLFF